MTTDVQEKFQNFENLYTKSMKSCSREFRPERVTYTSLHNHFSYGLSKSAEAITVGFVKLLSTHPIHIAAWGNFLIKKMRRTLLKKVTQLDFD